VYDGVPVVTATVADALAVPPSPVQARENVPVLVSAPLDWLPEIALLPVHAPEARQEVALVEDQLSVEDPPLATDVGLAARDTAGAGGGGVAAPDSGVFAPPHAASARESRGARSNAFVGNIGILIP
jgi:hypothetical protein